MIEELKERIYGWNLEGKPAEWSEEDEEMFEAFMHKLEVCDLLTNKEIMWAKLRLKSLYPHPKQEWSEEEKEILDNILSHYVLIDKPIDANGIPKEKYISLIKSIRFDTYKNCNSHWKPSEEQMKALYDACCIAFKEERDFHPSLSRLYHDLRKL